MNILGINAYHGDAAAVLVQDGQLISANEEERFRRIKHVSGFPTLAVRACLAEAGIDGAAIDHVAIARRPRAHLWRKAWFALKHRPQVDLLRDRAANYRHVSQVSDVIAEALGLGASARRPTVHAIEHHPAHLASAFFVSGFEDAAVCAVDGFGDFVSTSQGVGHKSTIDVRHRTFFPHSLGILYLALTQHLGFTAFGDEYKVMGLAPYGRPEFAEPLRRLLDFGSGGDFTLNLSYFQHWRGDVPMTWEDGCPSIGTVASSRLAELVGPARKPDEPVESRHEAIAASVQAVFEEAFFHVLNGLYARVKGSPAAMRLCLAGGCAMNSVANGRIREQTPFADVFIQPAAADNGTALGAAMAVWHEAGRPPRAFVMRHGYWGPSFNDHTVATALAARQADLTDAGCESWVADNEVALCDRTASDLADGLVVGWFQGRMEWGARALGNRSILADPRRENMRDVINVKIKFRERFRPFAPSILEESRDEYFVDAVEDPFMMQVRSVRPEKRRVLPAVTHVDGTGRLHTVGRPANPRFWALLRAFERLTGVPVLLNTSFNENEPIVCQPSEALDCFLRTDMDVLVLGNHVVTKSNRTRAPVAIV